MGTMIFSGGVWSQDTGNKPEKPLPPDSVNGAPVNSGDGGTDVFPMDQAKLTSDSRPLGGAQELTVGTVNKTYNFLLPSFSVVAQALHGPLASGATGSSTTSFQGFVAGRLALNHVSTYSSVALDYMAGGSFSANSNLGNSAIQSLSFAYTFQRGRWTTMLGDELSYASASSFGYGGLGGFGSLGIGLGNGVGSSAGFLPNFLPDQTLFLNGAAALNNAVIGQESYAVTHRSSLTFAGSYGILKYFDAGFRNGDSTAFQAGYNYALSRKDGISLAYQFDRFSFFSAPVTMMSHGVVFLYSRRVTGRMSFQVGAGPQFQHYQGVSGGNQNTTSWTLQSSLHYEIGRTTVGANYNHAQTGGSGILLGAETDTVTGSVGRTLNRYWDGSLNGGYSRNRTLMQTLPTGGPASPGAWFATGQINRHFVQYGSLFISYGFQHQSSLAGLCTLPQCGSSSNTQFISLGYTWGLRPWTL
jgi:hypothetical protein